MSDFWEKPITYIKGIGPQKAELLQKELEIFNAGDLLQHYPFRYIDRSKIYLCREISSDLAYVQLSGKITNFRELGEKRAKRLVADFYDTSGKIELVWFRGIQWVSKNIIPGKEYIVFGKPQLFNGHFNIPHPEIEDPELFKIQLVRGVQPVYPTTEKLKARGLESRAIQKLIASLINDPQFFVKEIFPPSVLKDYALISRQAAIKEIHFPSNEEMLAKAQFRIKLEEFFSIQMKMIQLRGTRKQLFKGFKIESVGELFNEFYHKHLPFELTNAQKRVLKEIRSDMGTGKQMNRLVQGDVGSGKTIVAFMSMLMLLDSGFQCCMMVPTEILAQQHFNSLSKLAQSIGIKIDLLTGSVSRKEKNRIYTELESGEIKILVGTHALIEDKVNFQNLGLVVIDEQHRFGVQQRAKLWDKNIIKPHILVMTATPIPRTLAMTVYGDLDTSVIDELPAGRKPIQTAHRNEAHRLRVFGFLKEQIKSGRQVYIVYPLIEESEKLDYNNLMEGYESISRAFPLPEYAISIVHGRMKPEDKDFEMQRFKRGETQIMVATTVIEVGVDVPNASVMVIENSEKFGLAQLHQLRGRVGRGAEQSYCILITGNKVSTEGKKRIETMVRTNNGFEIAEVDLKLRGPGDLEGLRQSGAINLKLADITKDGEILSLARSIAEKIFNQDPNLSSAENQGIREFIKREQRNNIWSRIS